MKSDKSTRKDTSSRRHNDRGLRSEVVVALKRGNIVPENGARPRSEELSPTLSSKTVEKNSSPIKEDREEVLSPPDTPKRETTPDSRHPTESGRMQDSKKYSKFDSSPEPELSEDDIEMETIETDEDAHTSEDDNVQDLSALEGKDWDELTEEEKAMLSPDTLGRMEDEYQKGLISHLPVYYPGISGCRNVAEFECLNRIEEGTFGVVYRALEKKTDEVVALKRLKMEKEREGFPITSLREINMLLKCGNHPNVVNVREIVVGSNMDKIYLVMEYVEHDMKSLMDLLRQKKKKFTIRRLMLTRLCFGLSTISIN
jgi:hypothetical protein